MKEGRQPGVESLHEVLREMGIFTDGFGPNDGSPVQIWGILASGEFVYFRAHGFRELYVEIRQAKSAVADDLDNHDGDLIVRYDLPIADYRAQVGFALLGGRVPLDIVPTLDRCPEPGQPYNTTHTLGASTMNHDTAALILRRWLRKYLASKSQ